MLFSFIEDDYVANVFEYGYYAELIFAHHFSCAIETPKIYGMLHEVFCSNCRGSSSRKEKIIRVLQTKLKAIVELTNSDLKLLESSAEGILRSNSTSLTCMKTRST